MNRLKEKADAPSMKIFDDEWEEEHLWKVRESGLGSDRSHPRRARCVGRVGRFGRTAAQTWRIPSRSPQTAEKVQLHGRPLWPLRSRVRAYANQLRPENGVRRRALPQISERSGRPGGAIWRLDLRRARRRSIEGGVLPKMFGPDLVRAFGEFKANLGP